ncbi:hypothetical protein MTO96_034287 [Rhipicephalus appendiculatus]
MRYSLRLIILVVAAISLFFLRILYRRADSLSASARNWWAGDIVDFEGADNVTGFDRPIVPNIVHFVRLGNASLSLVEAVCIRAAWIQQRPTSLVVHCDRCEEWTRSSAHWPLVSAIPGLRLATGSAFCASTAASSSTATRTSCAPWIRFGRFEMALGWYPKQALGTQVLVAHKNARFLELWYNSYRYYRPELWYWNAGRLPTEMILVPRPHLVHRVPYDFGVHNVAHLLYGVCKPDWRQFFAIHLLFRHRSYLVTTDTFGPLTVSNVGRYNTTFGQMVRLALFGTTRLGDNTLKEPQWFLQNELEYALDAC